MSETEWNQRKRKISRARRSDVSLHRKASREKKGKMLNLQLFGSIVVRYFYEIFFFSQRASRDWSEVPVISHEPLSALASFAFSSLFYDSTVLIANWMGSRWASWKKPAPSNSRGCGKSFKNSFLFLSLDVQVGDKRAGESDKRRAWLRWLKLNDASSNCSVIGGVDGH